MDVERDLELLLDERACERLVYEYAWAVDSGEASAIADLFTEDGVWEAADGRRFEGRDEIRRAFTGRQGLRRRTSMHVCTNVLVRREGPDDASGTSYLLNYRHDTADDGVPVLPVPAAPPKFVGIYHDRYVRTAAGWKMSYRRFELRFLRPRSR